VSLSTRLRRVFRRRPASELARAALQDVAGGRLAHLPVAVRFWDGSVLEPVRRPAGDAPPTLVVRSRRALAHILHEPGELGLSRAYVDGSLATEGDLEQLLALRRPMRAITLSGADRARLALGTLRLGGPAVLRRPPVPAIEGSTARRHSLASDRDAIRHHYDLSNDFYRLVLGPSLVYSCAYFNDEGDSLEQAQERKLDVICRKLRLGPGDRFLDVGCGWGSLVLHAAERYGVRATGITLSAPQATLARERAAELGLADRVEIRVADYRELGARQFDKIASVGMYEHVGHGELDGYVNTLHELLRPGGLALHHGISQLHGEPPDDRSFIARYIFPDGELQPLARVLAALQRGGLEVRDVESLREHYALTLRRWVANLRVGRRCAIMLVGPERTRTWELYMAGSARAFDAGEISVYQVLTAREDGPHGLPLDRLQLVGSSESRTST
jgi:cyclopropane-fatty-acyl-phospholipid synthase